MIRKARRIGLTILLIWSLHIAFSFYLYGSTISCQISGTCYYLSIPIGTISCQGSPYSAYCSKGWDYIECDGNRIDCPNTSNLCN